MCRPLLVALMVTVAGTVDAAGPPQAWSHLRCLTGPSQKLAASAVERSPLIATFVKELERSDVIVYLELLTAPHGELHAWTTFVAWTGGNRYLLLQVDGRDTGPSERIAMLGHELCHALEVARAPQVHDTASFRRLYEDIGTQWGPDRFETADARAAERRVRDDVTSSGSRRGRSHAGEPAAGGRFERPGESVQ